MALSLSTARCWPSTVNVPMEQERLPLYEQLEDSIATGPSETACPSSVTWPHTLAKRSGCHSAAGSSPFVSALSTVLSSTSAESMLIRPTSLSAMNATAKQKNAVADTLQVEPMQERSIKWP